jgi:hypothetical protein
MPEVWFPGSDKPFHPVNGHGRSMGKAKPAREPLYQLVVTRQTEHRGKEQVPMFPKMGKAAVDELYHAVSTAIRLGVEKELSDPHVVRVLV